MLLRRLLVARPTQVVTGLWGALRAQTSAARGEKDEAELRRVVQWLRDDRQRVAAVAARLNLTVRPGGVDPGATFEAADLNRDGVIDGQEFSQFLAAQHQRTGRRIKVAGRQTRDKDNDDDDDKEDSVGGTDGKLAINPPSTPQLRRLFLRSMVPMIGFGFVDNFLMLIAGDAIDSSLGTTLHISTLAAAALGNLASDIAGLGLSSSIETGAARLGIANPGLTTQQLELSSSRLVMLLANIIGISIGCLLGMVPLLFMDTEKREIEAVFEALDSSGPGRVSAAELKTAAPRLGLAPMTDAQFSALLRSNNLDSGTTLTLSCDDFVQLLRPLLRERHAPRAWWQFW